MKIRHFCTYFDHNYLPRGMVMLESLHAHCPGAIVHVLCLSEECHAALTSLNYPFVRLLRLAELETADPELLAVRPTRSLVEYYFTLTPCLPWHLLRNVPGIDAITYLDADMMFFSSPEPIFEEAGDASVILTPHRFSSHLADKIVYGTYNVSWLTFNKTQNGLEALVWYRGACLEWCFDRLEDGRFADQKYLDMFPTRFKQIHEIQNVGAGVAPWNIASLSIEKKGDTLMASGQALIFYHAHDFKKILGPFFSSGLANYGIKLHKNIKECIFFPYSRVFKKNTHIASSLLHSKTNQSLRDKNTHRTVISIYRSIWYEYKSKTLLFL